MLQQTRDSLKERRKEGCYTSVDKKAETLVGKKTNRLK